MRTLLHPALLSCVLFAWSAAAEEATSYLSVEAATQELARIEYFVTLDETCKPTPTPTINMLEKPKFGALLALQLLFEMGSARFGLMRSSP